ncbi:MAG: GPP34 family phosphoprotein, partial [Deltaproteobacteria bacterium]|nr:GPP34 family phosphoprotein [Deltaproteobacteria bacterium]
MALSTDGIATRQLSLPEELLLMLLNGESGYFHQVPGWDLNCAVIGAVLAELSLVSRIDTDRRSLILLDRTAVGDPALDPILKEIAEEPVQQNARYWIERLAPRADSIIDLTLDRLVGLKILEHHDGDFWTLSHAVGHEHLNTGNGEGTAVEFVTSRITKVIFYNEIPTPRDIIIVGLLNTCDVLRFIFELDDESEARIKVVCQLELIGRSIAEAVAHNLAGPLLRRSHLTKKIPTVPLRKLLFNSHLRNGNIPALFADLAQEYGPVFKLRPPFKKPMIFLAGPETNHWTNKRGRMYLRAKDYFADFEKIYGANGVLPSLDGADHFR